MNSAVYEGWVAHTRRAPVDHRFRYRIFMMYLDLAELDDVFRGRWLWSVRRPNLAWFNRRDHLGDPDRPLDDCVRDLVETSSGVRPSGPIRLLTHLRYFGYVMNPVSFFYCFDAADERVETIVAEVHNTPWGERHCYVLDPSQNESSSPNRLRYRFDKAFHVSPFMSMEQTYAWRFSPPDETLSVSMQNIENDERIFDATLALERRALNGATLARMLGGYPFMTGKVIAAIYLQAARLWWKRCPFVPHPDRPESNEDHPTAPAATPKEAAR